MNARTLAKLSGLTAFLVALFLVYLVSNSHSWSFLEMWREIWRPGYQSPANSVLWIDRMPRACACATVGAILGMVGSALQALFRNPIADPYVVGVSSGAAVGGAIAFVTGFGANWGGFGQGLGLMICAFPAGLLALGIVFGLSRQRGVVNVQTLLLAGVVTGSMLNAVLSFVLLRGGKDTNVVLQWLLGDISFAFWNKDELLLCVLLAGAAVLIGCSKQLNAFALGEETAQRLGVNVSRLKLVILVTSTAMVSATVGAVGVIGFLGLAAPHIARRTLGVDWRISLIGSGLIGACLLLIADFIAQRALPGGEIPVGIVTAIVGAPLLLVLLRKDR
jgi:iron complex transport system permease protein